MLRRGYEGAPMEDPENTQSCLLPRRHSWPHRSGCGRSGPTGEVTVSGT